MSVRRIWQKQPARDVALTKGAASKVTRAIGTQFSPLARLWMGVWPTVTLAVLVLLAGAPKADPHVAFSATALLPPQS